MPESFDPYYKWLQIPSAEQPPHHYRLLGLTLFESDRDVIAGAADQRIAHIRTFQAGKHSELSQKILNELATAQLCLLNADRKAEYDAALRARLAGSQRPAPRVRSLPQAVPLVAATPQPTTSDFEPVEPPVLRRKPKSRSNAPLLIGIGAVAIAASVVAAIFLSGSDQQVAKSTAEKAGPSPTSSPETPVDKPASSNATPAKVGPEATAKDSHPQAKSTKTPSTHTPAKESATPENSAESEEPPVDSPAEDEPSSDVPEEMSEADAPSDDATDEKLPVPDLSAATKSVAEVFGQEMKAATTLQKHLDLSQKLRDAAGNSSPEDAEWYVLMDTARREAAAGADVETAMRALDELLEYYDLDPIAERAKTLRDIAKVQGVGAKDVVPVNKLLAVHAQALADDAAVADRFPAAAAALEIATSAARKTKDTALIKAVNVRNREIEQLAKAYQPIENARQTLATSPNDAEANLTLGKYLCFSKGDWELGLSRLALGSDATLKSLAEKELSDDPDAVAIADAWWAAAEKESAAAKSLIQSHSANWYRQALPALSGLEKARVQQRVATAPNSETENLQGLDEPRETTVRRGKSKSSTGEPVIVGNWRVTFTNGTVTEHITAEFLSNRTFIINNENLANFVWRDRGKGMFDVTSPWIQGSVKVSKDQILGSFQHRTLGEIEWRGTRVTASQINPTESASSKTASKDPANPRGKSTKGKAKPTLVGKWEVNLYRKDGTLLRQVVLEFLPDETFWNVTTNTRHDSLHWKDIGNGEFDYTTAWERGTLTVSAKEFIGNIQSNEGPLVFRGKRIGDAP